MIANRSLFVLSLSAVLAACGGGGGDGDHGGNDVTYIQQLGLKWSSPSKDTYKNPQGLTDSINTPFAIQASAYCSSQTCDTDAYGRQSNCRQNNFNGEDGWRLPKKTELEALIAANVLPSDWKNYVVWTDTSWNVNLTTGSWLYAVGNNAFNNVMCVKPI